MTNDCIDPPPEEVPEDRRPKVAYPDELNGHEDIYLPIRKARVSDVEALLELVNGFAAQNLMLPRGPQYLFENIRDYAVIVDESAGGQIVACGSLHVLWDDMAEIRSMAIHGVETFASAKAEPTMRHYPSETTTLTRRRGHL